MPVFELPRSADQWYGMQHGQKGAKQQHVPKLPKLAIGSICSVFYDFASVLTINQLCLIVLQLASARHLVFVAQAVSVLEVGNSQSTPFVPTSTDVFMLFCFIGLFIHVLYIG